MSRLTESAILALRSASIPSVLVRHDRITLLAIAAALLGTTLALPSMYRDYRIFKSYGPGGVPNNVFGWIVVRTLFAPFSREMLSTKEYETRDSAVESDGKEDTGFLILNDEQLGVRTSSGRPEVGPHPVPQRQLTQLPDEAVKQKFRAAFSSFAHRNHHLVKLSPSLLERHTDGLFLADNIASSVLANKWGREISHFHGGNDYSVHAILSPADCKKPIETGWAQRHAFSGTLAMTVLSLGTKPDLPSGYVLIYAPRNEMEIEIVMQIVAASVRFMTMRDDVK